jgi:hypothetical protein
MSKGNSASPILASLILLMLCLLSPINNAQVTYSPRNPVAIATLEMLDLGLAPQKGPQIVAGAPLKGCDVKLGKPPGGSPAARTTTDSKGKFNLGVMPKGAYFLTLDLPDESTAPSAEASRKTDPSNESKACLITIDGAAGGQIKRGWDPKHKKPFELGSQNTAKSSDQEKIILESDGRTPLTGIVQTAIVKSKSNITNN